MKFMVLVYGQEEVEAKMSQDEWQALLAEHNAFGTKYGEKVLAGDALEPTHTAKTIRQASGTVTVMDGPFAETKEQLGGFYIIEAADINEAVAMARDLPMSEHSSVEVRPVMPLGS